MIIIVSMRFLRTSLVFAVVACSATAFAAESVKTVYVDAAFQGDSPTGASWNSAFPSLSRAIDAAAENGGGNLWVKAGVYKPDGNTRGATIELKPGITILGGFRGAETTASERNPKANRTILSGDIGRIGSHSDNSYHILKGASDCVLDGFIIQRGNADAAAEHRGGGGLTIPNGVTNLTLSDCTFENNNADLGGAIFIKDAALSITNCTFYANSAEQGGALHVLGNSRVEIQDTIFSANHGRSRGGACDILVGAEVVIRRGAFLLNNTLGSGGAVAASVGEEANAIVLDIINSSFSGNGATTTGGATAFQGDFSPVIRTSQFEKNHSRSGAGAIAAQQGAQPVLLENSFSKNRGARGSETLGADTLSRFVESTQEGEQRASETRAKLTAWRHPAPAEPETPDPAEKPPRMVPDVFVKNGRNMKVKLRDALPDAKMSVYLAGDLTDPQFIKEYRSYEALAKDYAPNGVRFVYVYKWLKHPENNGFLPPFNETERAQQVRVAIDQLGTRIPWTFDLMDNDAAAALAPAGINAVFAYDATGAEVFAGPIGDAGALRALLESTVGRSSSKTRPDSLPAPRLQPIKILGTEYVRRPRVNRLSPLQATPLQSRSPFYAKLRVEADDALLKTGNGKLYMGFLVDPLYKVSWNNRADPLHYTLKPSSGVIAPSVKSAERVTETPMDAEPREFVLEARKLDLSKPIPLQVNYSVYSSAAKKSIEVSQRYIIYLEEDPFGGTVIGRQGAVTTSSRATSNPQNSAAFSAMLRRFDQDGDGGLSVDEAVGRWKRNFDQIDQNGDGLIDNEEFVNSRKR